MVQVPGNFLRPPDAGKGDVGAKVQCSCRALIGLRMHLARHWLSTTATASVDNVRLKHCSWPSVALRRMTARGCRIPLLKDLPAPVKVRAQISNGEPWRAIWTSEDVAWIKTVMSEDCPQIAFAACLGRGTVSREEGSAQRGPCQFDGLF